jgi:tetratricopeptide (TPR) repeat protein
MCSILKKLSNKLQSNKDEVAGVICEILDSRKGKDARVVGHVLLYAEFLFKSRLAGTDWKVDKILHGINARIAGIYALDNSISDLIRDEKRFPFYESSIGLLNSWLVHLNPDPCHQINRLGKDEINYLLQELYVTELRMASVILNRGLLDVAEGHSERCLSYARRISVEGDNKIKSISRALHINVKLRQQQGKFSDAIVFSEEAYNLVVEAYDPGHSLVQEAANVLIENLIQGGDYCNAERFAQQTYQNLRDVKNGTYQDSEAVAMGAFNLANVIYIQEGDFKKAEELSRDSIRIRTKLFGGHNFNLGITCRLLADILVAQKKFGDETRKLYERSLAISIGSDGPDGASVSSRNIDIGKFYHQLAMTQSTSDTKRKQLLLAKSYLEEGMRIKSKILIPCHAVEETILDSSLLSIVLSHLSSL